MGSVGVSLGGLGVINLDDDDDIITGLGDSDDDDYVAPVECINIELSKALQGISFSLADSNEMIHALQSLARYMCVLNRHEEALMIYTHLSSMFQYFHGLNHWNTLLFRFKDAFFCILFNFLLEIIFVVKSIIKLNFLLFSQMVFYFLFF